MPRPVSRRTFIRLAAAAAALAPGCALRRPPASPESARRFARVLVSKSRVIRTVTGLRPYRPSGFLLRAERAGEKLLIHDYGHGGGGVTLSWGTARLAVDEMNGWTGPQDRCAVIGCGAVGLATARLLQRRGAAVTIYAKDVPPNTTSNIAGAQWGPFSVFEQGKTTAAFDEQFTRAARLAWRLFQDLPGATYGIRWIDNYSIADRPQEQPVESPFYVNAADLKPSEHPFPGRYVRRFTTLLIEPPVYLAAMLDEFLLAGGRLVVREFESLQQVASLDEPIVFNCRSRKWTTSRSATARSTCFRGATESCSAARSSGETGISILIRRSSSGCSRSTPVSSTRCDRRTYRSRRISPANKRARRSYPPRPSHVNDRKTPPFVTLNGRASSSPNLTRAST
jgi:D-amino-acid oxidase